MELNFKLSLELDCDLFIQPTTEWLAEESDYSSDLEFKLNDALYITRIVSDKTSGSETVFTKLFATSETDLATSINTDGMLEIDLVAIPNLNWVKDTVNRTKLWDYSLFYDYDLDSNELLFSNIVLNISDNLSGTLEVHKDIIEYYIPEKKKSSLKTDLITFFTTINKELANSGEGINYTEETINYVVDEFVPWGEDPTLKEGLIMTMIGPDEEDIELIEYIYDEEINEYIPNYTVPFSKGSTFYDKLNNKLYLYKQGEFCEVVEEVTLDPTKVYIIEETKYYVTDGELTTTEPEVNYDSNNHVILTETDLDSSVSEAIDSLIDDVDSITNLTTFEFGIGNSTTNTSYNIQLVFEKSDILFYWYDGENIVKGLNNPTIVEDLNEIFEVNAELVPFKLCKHKETVLICQLVNCYILLCNNLLNNCCNKCLTRPTESLYYIRDLLTMAINVIKYSVDRGNLYRAQQILERITKCPGVCSDITTTVKRSGCGCSK